MKINKILVMSFVVVFSFFVWIGYSPAQEGIPATPEPTDMIIEYGDLINGSIGIAGDSDTFRFAGSSGEVVVVEATWHSGSLRPCIELVAPDNTRLEACSNSYTNEIDTTLGQTGTHTILATDWFGTNTGEFALTLERIIPSSPRDRTFQYGDTLEDEINPGGDIDVFFFEGTAGDAIEAGVNWHSGSLRPCIELVAPDNTRLEACSNSYTNEIYTTLGQTGTHAVLIRDWFGISSGEYAFGLQCLSGACVVVPTPATSGFFSYKGSPLPLRETKLYQAGLPNQTTYTDENGYYEFENVAPGKRFYIIIKGPWVPYTPSAEGK